MTRDVSIFFRKPRPGVERHYARTEDGWEIALHRFPNDGAVRAGRSPVLFCHGLGANRYNLDAPGSLSLARWMWAEMDWPEPLLWFATLCVLPIITLIIAEGFARIVQAVHSQSD